MAARSLKKKPEEITPSRSRTDPIWLTLDPLGIDTRTRPWPEPPNGWKSRTRNQTSATAAASVSRAATRRIMKTLGPCLRLPDDMRTGGGVRLGVGVRLPGIAPQPAREQMCGRARVLAGTGRSRCPLTIPLGQHRREALVIELHRNALQPALERRSEFSGLARLRGIATGQAQ